MKAILPTLAAIFILGSMPGRAGDKVDFNYDIRPIISAKCFQCHGPDEKARKAKLRLDLREEALKEHEDGRPIVPGDVQASVLVARITSKDADEVMPPPKEDHALSAAEIELLKKWIAQGAEYKPHWSFQKPERPAVPVVGAQESAVRNPIDAFILARLAAAGLKPSPEADRHALIRRLSFDLIGLPPTPAEVDAFVSDQSANAYEKLVDRLLAAPAYGERWAKMWLDLARYADSTGYGSDKFRLNIWPYRDWVIGAFNRNLTYDQFTIEQLAGDLLPEPTREQLVATAFHRNTMTNVEGGTIDEEYRVAAVKDRIATTGQVWMGLTVGCAQCHTHKFDPISHKDYYGFYGVFNQTEDSDREDEAPTMPLTTPEQQTKIDALKSEIAALEAKLKGASPELEAEQHEWEAQMLRAVKWQPLATVGAKTEHGTVLTARPDGSVLATGERPEADTYTLKVRADGREKITAFRLEVLPDDSLPGHGPGRADGGNAVLTQLLVSSVKADARPVRGRFVRVTLPGADNGLALAEVEVFSKGENVARRGTATQSSTDFGGEAPRAIDGKTDGDFYKGQSVTHTGKDKEPWWEVDLGADADIERMVIWNRTDGDAGKRLANFRVSIFDAAHKLAWEETVAQPPQPSVTVGPLEGKVVALRNASADFSQEGFPAAKALDGDKKTGWALAPEMGKAHAAVFEMAAPLDSPALLMFTLRQDYGTKHTLGRFRISATTAAPPVRELPAGLRAILALEPSEREPKQREELAAYFRPLSKSFAGLNQQLAAKRAELAAIKPVGLPVLRELAADKRRETHVLNKGNYLTPNEKVEPQLLSAFASFVPPETKIDRLAAARWIVNPANPLTARVAVNRFWSQLFGVGIVESEEDFGTQGSLPSHPELLDWLAVAFQSPKPASAAAVGEAASFPYSGAQPGLGWDMKALLKLMVTSATYRQSSRVTPEMIEKDARNRLLAHAPRQRLDAEAMRDQALALGGLLSPKMGGPSVYPPQPAGLWNVAFNGGQNGYPTSLGEDGHRRGLYTFWRRTMPYPSMTTFDAPSREACTVRRLPTNTPLQAFVTMNDPVFVECAQSLARRIVREGGADTAGRLRFALKLCTARPPADAQVQALAALYESELATYRADAAGAAKLATEPLGPLPANADAAEMAAWTVVANVLLNLDAVLTKS